MSLDDESEKECCMSCTHFISWQDLYDNDEAEPVDSGKCQEPSKIDDVFVDDAWTECCCEFRKIFIK
jgi:hypothetical protein